MTAVLQSLIAVQWLGRQHARQVGGPALRALGLQARAAILKALARYLGEHQEVLYALSAHTGATRKDGWIDIEGGSGTLAAVTGEHVRGAARDRRAPLPPPLRRSAHRRDACSPTDAR